MTRNTTIFRCLLSSSLTLAALASSATAHAEELPLAALRAAMPAEQSDTPPAEQEPAPQADKGAESAGSPKADERGRSFVPVLRGGISTAGKGEMTAECEGDFSCDGLGGTSYDENDSQMLEADFLWHTSPKLRLGFGTSYVRPNEKVEGRKYALGTEVGLFGVIEGVFPTSDSFAFTLRGQVGALLLIPGDDLAKTHEEQRQACRESTMEQCNTAKGPFVGRSTALGFGGRFSTGSVAFRLDLLAEAYSVQTQRFEVSDPAASGTVSAEHMGFRTWLLGGIEL